MTKRMSKGKASLGLLFAATLFVSAFLLFWIQPLIAKMLLPSLGGSPAVWNTCMLFFQGMLLAGYKYVLIATKWLRARQQLLLHLALLLLAALSLPVVVSSATTASLGPEGNPAFWLLNSVLSWN